MCVCAVVTGVFRVELYVEEYLCPCTISLLSLFIRKQICNNYKCFLLFRLNWVCLSLKTVHLFEKH